MQKQFYQSGKYTVALNVSGAVLTLPLRTHAKRQIVLHPRKGRGFIDVEQSCDPKEINAALQDLESMTTAGKLTWHKAGSKPVVPLHRGMRLPTAAGESVRAPANRFDRALTDLAEKDRKEDEKTKASNRDRDAASRETLSDELDGEQDVPTPIALHRGQTTSRRGDAAKGEVDAGADVSRPTRTASAESGEIDGSDVPGSSDIVRTGGAYDDTSVGELVDAAIKLGVVERKGSHYYVGGQQIASGKKATCEALESDPALLAGLREAMNTSATE